MAALPAGGGDAADSGVPDVTAPKVVHRVKSKMGYTEMHTTAPGFGENVRVPPYSVSLFSLPSSSNTSHRTRISKYCTCIVSLNLKWKLCYDNHGIGQDSLHLRSASSLIRIFSCRPQSQMATCVALLRVRSRERAKRMVSLCGFLRFHCGSNISVSESVGTRKEGTTGVQFSALFRVPTILPTLEV